MQKGAARLTGCSFYFCLFLRYRKISVFTNHAVAVAVIPKIAFIDQLYAKVAVLCGIAYNMISNPPLFVGDFLFNNPHKLPPIFKL